MTPEDLITLTTARTAQPLVVPGTGRPYWTLQEAGMACAKLEPEIYGALLYSYAGADGCYDELRGALVDFGTSMRLDEAWPMQVVHDDGTRGEYLDDLARVCLIEERHPSRFGKVTTGDNAPQVSPFYLALTRVTESIWKKRLLHPYATLRWRYITWLSIGRAHMKRWMRHELRDVAV